MATNANIVFDPPLQLEKRYEDMFARVVPPGGIPSIPPDYEIRTKTIGDKLQQISDVMQTSGKPKKK